jgi:hypothetical protein
MTDSIAFDGDDTTTHVEELAVLSDKVILPNRIVDYL